MLDLRLFREKPDWVDSELAKRGLSPVANEILELDAASRASQTEIQVILRERNKLSKEVGRLKGKGEEAKAEALMLLVVALKDQLTKLEEKQVKTSQALNKKMSFLPNFLAEDVPNGESEEDNMTLEHWGDIPKIKSPKDHVDLGEALRMYDPALAAKMSGARFTILTGALARLERALGQFMIDTLIEEFGFKEVSVPALVNEEALFRTTQLPKFSEDLFKTTDGRWLIPTAEVPLTNMAANRIFNESDFPMRYAALTPCFRSEAGSAGRDTRGMIRQHQFWKVEMVTFSHPDKSTEEHQHMTRAARAILEKLNLAYRIVNLCSADIGFAAKKTYDIEVWVPSQNTYREISSCSNCGDFQARRMRARFKRKDAKKPDLIHTLNGSGLAVGRCLVAVLENYQQPDGSIKIPEVLIPYMRGQSLIQKETA